MGFGVQGGRSFAIGPGGQRNPRTKHDTGHAAAAVGILDHRSERIIPVADNVHAGSGAQVQIPSMWQEETEATSSSSGL